MTGKKAYTTTCFSPEKVPQCCNLRWVHSCSSPVCWIRQPHQLRKQPTPIFILVKQTHYQTALPPSHKQLLSTNWKTDKYVKLLVSSLILCIMENKHSLQNYTRNKNSFLSDGTAETLLFPRQLEKKSDFPMFPTKATKQWNTERFPNSYVFQNVSTSYPTQTINQTENFILRSIWDSPVL